MNATKHRALTCLYSFKETDGLLTRWIEKLGEFDFENKHEAGKKIPHADCLSKVPQTNNEVKDFNQVNQVNTENKNMWSIGLEKSVEQLVGHQKKATKLILLRKGLRAGKRPKRSNLAQSKRVWQNMWVNITTPGATTFR